MAYYWWCIIRDLYQQQWRKYHTLNHIDKFTTLGTKYYNDGVIKDYVNCLLTIWFHDIIYVPTRKDNEDVIYFLYTKCFREALICLMNFILKYRNVKISN